MVERERLTPGTVYLVGAGPGDPGLITVKGLACLRQADVLIYDRLVGAPLLTEARADCQRIDVGKQAGRQALDQAGINALLIEHARAGRVVTRLKGGDPFVFGRGGEEAAALAMAGLPFVIVPGITSAIAGPAYAGIPLTHRAFASAFQVITGHEDPDKPESALAWRQLAAGRETLVVLMGMERLAAIAARLIEHGRPAGTPAAVVRWATDSRQQTVVGTLADIAERARQAELAAPAVIVIGEVVRLRNHLRWFDTHPLFGRRILVARSRAQISRLSQQLAAVGANPIELPSLTAVAPVDERPLTEALAQLATFDWVLFTSQTAVERSFEQLAATGRDARAFGAARVAAAGPGTVEALAARGIRAEASASGAVTARLAAALAPHGLAGCRLLLLGADEPYPALVAALERGGAHVERVASYRLAVTVDPTARQLVRAGDIDAVVIAGSGAARNLAAALGDDLSGLSGRPVVAIGPTAAATASAVGLTVSQIAAEASLASLMSALGQLIDQPRPSLVAV